MLHECGARCIVSNANDAAFAGKYASSDAIFNALHDGGED